MEPTTFLCVKHGDKYTSVDVNNLYKMVKRNTSLPFIFICLTDSSHGLHKDIQVYNLPDLPLERWWWKIFLFKEQWPGIKFYLDLDVAIQNNIDWLITKTDTIQITDHSHLPIFGNYYHNDQLYNSSMMIWTNNFSNIYEKFIRDYSLYTAVYRGLDGYLTSEVDCDLFSPLPPKALYSRNRGDAYQLIKPYDKVDGIATYYEKDYSVCMFNQCFEHKYLKHHRIYFL